MILRTLLVALAAIAPAVAGGQDYPSRPVRVVVPFSPGGAVDGPMRMVAQELAKRWGQQVVVENKPGAGATIGTEMVAKAAPDGYTLLLASQTNAISATLYQKLTYDPIEDFAPIASLGVSPQVLTLNPGVPANTVQELIALAKAKPGQLNFASSGAGGPTHLSGELFNLLAGVKTQHIPYKGGGPAMIDLLGGHVQMFFSVPINILGHVKSGKLKALAVSGESRIAALPQMPTFTEAGLPGFDVKTWNGVLAPAGTPRAIVDKLSGEIAAILGKAEVREKLNSLGMSTMISTPEQFGALIASDLALYRKVVKSAHIRID